MQNELILSEWWARGRAAAFGIPNMQDGVCIREKIECLKARKQLRGDPPFIHKREREREREREGEREGERVTMDG